MSPSSIAHVITGLDTGGAEMMLLKLLGGTDRQRWQPGVVSLRDHGTLGHLIQALGVPVATIGIRGSVPSPSAVWRLRRELRAFAPRIIQGWMYHGNLAALAGLMMGPGRVPVVWNVRYTLLDLASEKRVTAMIIRLGALLSSRAVRIIYNSRTSAQRHADFGYAAERAVVIPNGFDTQSFAPSPSARAAFRSRLGVDDQAIVIGRVGRYHPMKDYPCFLEAAARVARLHPTVRFVLAGQGVDHQNRELVAQIDERGLGEVVHPVGEVLPVNELMAALDIMCSSSAYGEGFPSVLGEAMACEVPCVTTAVGDSAWIVGDTGRVVPPKDSGALAAALQVLIDAGAEGRRRFGVDARARVIREYSLARVVSAYEGLYEEILQAREGHDR